MKKIQIVFIIFYLTFFSISLNPGEDKIILGIHHNPPFTFEEENGIKGFIVDILKDFCQKNEIKIEYRKANFSELLNLLKKGKIDVLAPLVYTRERAESILFVVEPIRTDSANIIIPVGSNLKSLNALASKVVGGVKEDFAFNQLKKDLERDNITCRFKEYGVFSGIVDDVVEGKIDAGVISTSSYLQIQQDGGKKVRLKLLPEILYPMPIYIGVNRSRTFLFQRLNSYLKAEKTNPDSALKKSQDFWLKDLITPKKFVFFSRYVILAMVLVGGVIFLVIFFNLLLRNKVKKATLEINRQRSYFYNLFMTIPAGIVILDLDNKVLDINSEFERMFQYNLEEIKGADIDDLLADEDQLEIARSATRSAFKGERVVLEARRKTRDNKYIDVQIVGSPIIIDKKIAGALAIYVDRTEQKKLESEISRAKNIESLGMLAGGIAHDFNNMLTGILGNISLARRRIDDNKLAELLTRAENASFKARGLAHQLLTFSRGGASIKEVASLVKIVKDSVELVFVGSHIQPEIHIKDDVLNVEVDVTQMTQVFNNILLNARQSMESGHITVNIGNFVQAKDSGFLNRGRYVSVTVKDQGVGIPEEDLTNIFTPYFSTKKEGSGLGLSISYSIVRKHKGNIVVNSEVGKGTEFIVYIPATDKPLREDEKEGELLNIEARILLMDDEKIIGDVFRDMLENTNWTVDIVKNSQEVIQFYSGSLACGQKYDIVFLDLTIPGDIGGISTLEKLRELDADTYAIAISGYSDSELFTNPGRYFFKDILAKPFSQDQLLEKINTNLKRCRLL